MDETTEATPEALAPEVSTQDAVHAFGVTKSKTHGRIRMRMDKEHRSPEQMAQLKAQLEQDERVSDVAINQRTGSVTVRHATEHDGHAILHKAFKEAELITEVVLEVEPMDEEGEGEGGGGQAKLDQQIADLMVKVDQAIYRRTGGKLHARGRVVPLSIAGLGVAQIVAYGISLEMLPGPVLLWLAFDIHRRFVREHPYSMFDDKGTGAGATGEAETFAAVAPATA